MKIRNSLLGNVSFLLLFIFGGCTSESQYLSKKMDGFWKITSIRDEYELGGFPNYPGRTAIFNIDYPDSLHYSELKSIYLEKYNKGAGKASGYVSYYGTNPTKLIDNWCMTEPFDSLGGGFLNNSDTTGFLSIYLSKAAGARYAVKISNRQRQTWISRFMYRGKWVRRTIEMERDRQ
jgi:hypothetical protein